jgi:hypothetical protein
MPLETVGRATIVDSGGDERAQRRKYDTYRLAG